MSLGLRRQKLCVGVCCQKVFVSKLMFMSHLGMGINSTEAGTRTHVPDADMSVTSATSSG